MFRGSLVKEQGDGAALYGHIIRLARRENAQTRSEDTIQIVLLGLFLDIWGHSATE